MSVKLDALNAEFLTASPMIDATRGRRRWLVGIMDVCGGLLGAGIGSVGGPALSGFLAFLFGGSASACAYADEQQTVSLNIITQSHDVEYVELVRNPTEFDRVGNDHNLVLQNISEEFGSDFFAIANADDLYNAMLGEAADMGYDLNEFNANAAEYRVIFEELFDKVTEGDVEAVYEKILELTPSITNEVGMVKSYIDTYVAIESDHIMDYSVRFRDIVVESDIPLESKQMLQSAVSIGVASNELWTIEK